MQNRPIDPTEDLARFLAALELRSVPEAVREHAKDLLLDSIGCALAAEHGEETIHVANTALTLGGQGDSTVLGVPDRRSMAAAVLLNGFRITATTACDVYAPADLHSTPEVVPAAIAVGELRGSSGADLLRGVVAGLETSVRIVSGFSWPEFRRRGWHSPGIAGPFGAAAATASLLKLDAATTRNALAIAGSQAAGTWAARGTPTVKFQQARAALAGVMSGLLASEGLTGASEVLVGPEGGMFVAYADGDPEQVVAGLGQRWLLEDISLRLWPGGARVQPPMTATAQLKQESEVRWEEIDRVVVHVAPAIARTQAWAAEPAGTFAAMASIPYTVAVTLRHGAAAPRFFAAACYEEAAMRDFVSRRIEVRGDAAVPSLGATVEVLLRDGTRHTASVDVPKGHPQHRASREELFAKVHMFADERVGPAAADELIERVGRIETETSLEPILRLTRSTIER